MKKMSILTLSVLLSLPSFSQEKKDLYQYKPNPQCQGVQLNEERTRDLIAMTLIKEPALLKKFLENYCFSNSSFKGNQEESPFFFARDPETFKVLLSTNTNINIKNKTDGNTDPLTFYLVTPFVDYGDIEKREVQRHLKQMVQTYGIPDFSNKSIEEISVADRQAILKLILQNYEKKDYYHRDMFGNSASTYALLTLEPEVFEASFTLKPSLALLQKNKDALTLVHIAFLPKYSKLSSDVQKVNLSKINKFIAENVSEKALALSKVQKLAFVDYMELMKENNMELYQLLKPMFKEPAKDYQSMSDENKINNKKFFEGYDYIRDLKEFIQTGIDDAPDSK